MSVKTVIGQVCSQQNKSLLNLGGMTGDIAAAIIQRAPNLEEIGIKITDVNLGNISFNAEDQQLLRDANKERGAARAAWASRPTRARPSSSSSIRSSTRTRATCSSSPATGTTTPPARR